MPYKDPQKRREYLKLYQIKNKDILREKSKEYVKKNYSSVKKRRHDWYMKNRVLSSRVLLTEEQKQQKRKVSWEKWYLINRQKKIDDNKIWVKNNKKRRSIQLNKYQFNRRKTDEKFRINQNLSNYIKLCIKTNASGCSWEKVVGYSLGDLKNHLQKQFDEKMNWDNYGKYWHIDHIKPKILFKYVSKIDNELKECWALSNLRPLDARRKY